MMYPVWHSGMRSQMVMRIYVYPTLDDCSQRPVSEAAFCGLAKQINMFQGQSRAHAY